MENKELLLHLAIAPLAPNIDSFTMRDSRARAAFVLEYDNWYRRLQELLETTDVGVEQWSAQYQTHCSRFCHNMKLSKRIERRLLKFGELSWNEAEDSLRPAGFHTQAPPYPSFIQVIEMVVMNKLVVQGIGEGSEKQLALALMKYYKGEVPVQSGALG